MSKVINNEGAQNEPSKKEKLYNIFVSAFDVFRKTKKDPKHQKIKEAVIELKNYKDNFQTFNSNAIQKYSFIFVSPLDKCNTECMEIILSSMEEILNKNLIEPFILQKMVEKLISYFPIYLRNNEIDYKVNSKILHMCELIYGYPGIFVHNENLKSIIKIYLRIYLSMSNVEIFQNQTQKTLSVIISKMIGQMKECNISNKNSICNFNETNIEQTAEFDKKKKLLYKLQQNEFNFIVTLVLELEYEFPLIKMGIVL
jgi:hypothetical protein